ncbi:MAG TPA: guanylate kinase [Blastocatellia bacterium]
MSNNDSRESKEDPYDLPAAPAMAPAVAGAAPGGVVLVVSAPSGAGKSSLIRSLLEAVGGVRFSVSYTTRAPRGAEKDGIDYHFVTRDEFIAMRGRGEFLESAEVHGFLYGTHIESVRNAFGAGEDIVLDVDIQGAEQIRRRMPEAVTAFVLPPSRQVLEARLRARNLNSRAELEFRLNNAVSEVRKFDQFDYIIVNDDLARASKVLEAIIIAERHRKSRTAGLAHAIIDTFGKGAT